MASGNNQDLSTASGGDVAAEPVAAAATLAAIDRAVFPKAKEIPFYEQSVLIRRAVIRLFGHG